MFVYTAEPGSKSEQALNLLASWTATPHEESADADHEEQPRHQLGPSDWFTGSVYLDPSRRRRTPRA